MEKDKCPNCYSSNVVDSKIHFLYQDRIVYMMRCYDCLQTFQIHQFLDENEEENGDRVTLINNLNNLNLSLDPED